MKISYENLKIIKNEKGNIIKYFSINSKHYNKFGEIYFSEIKKNKIKAWKMQKKNSLNLAVPVGKVKFVFYDRFYNLLNSIIIDKKNFKLINVPPFIWYGFQGLERINLISNFIEDIHNDNDIVNLDLTEIDHDWSKN